APATLNGLRWQGPLGGLLDNITARTGLSWRTDHGAVVFYLTETRTFQFAFLNTRVNSNASVSSGSTSSMGTSGGSGGGDNSVSGDSSSSQKTTTLQDRDAYEDIRKTMETILTPEKGRYWLSESTGVLTVTDTPQVLETVSHYVDEQNREMNRQVQLSVKVLSVSNTRNEQFGIDWGLVYKSLQQVGATLNNAGGDIAGATSTGVSILDTATGSAARFSGSSLLIKALSEQGDISVVTSQDSTVTNLTPVPIQMADQTVYVAGSATTTTTDVGATTTLTPGMITTGFNMTLLPLIRQAGDVQLQVNFNLSDPPTIRSFTSKDGNSYIEMPYTKLRSLSQKVNLRAGQSLVLTGFSQDNTSVRKSGTFTPGNFLFGGGRKGEHGRSTLVIIITPLLAGNNGD
ncbi:PilN family type IVB pilus formation outer membrane protein, partial [Salmonella enterica]|nr:PilN family type IVB pilus formation outer membrane protein [Salmonella enterica]